VAALVLCPAIVVLAAADRPSVLSATTTAHYFPGWMAGPFGGLLPWLTRDPTVLRYLFTSALVFMYVAYAFALRHLPRAPASWTIAAIVAVHLLLFLSPPLALTDIFNYVDYGRMEVFHHLNPYTTTPILEPHSDPAFALSNWHQLLSPYGPLFTLITFAVVPLGLAGSFWALKAVLAAASLTLVLLVWKSARLLGRDPVAAVALVGLNPVVIMWGLGGDHNDFITMMFVALAFYCLLRTGSLPSLAASAERDRRRAAALRLLAGAALVTAVALKASAAILAPVVLAPLVAELGRADGALARAARRRELFEVLAGMALAALVWGLASVFAFGAHIPDLATQGRLVTMYSFPNLLGIALFQGGETEWLRLALSGVLLASIAWCAVSAYRRRESLTPAGWATVALLVTLSWALPWYILWLLPLAALAGNRRLRTVALVLGVYYIVAWAPVSSGIFHGLGIHPERTSLGKLHQRYVKELLY
jgi:hypothetical protein